MTGMKPWQDMLLCKHQVCDGFVLHQQKKGYPYRTHFSMIVQKEWKVQAVRPLGTRPNSAFKRSCSSPAACWRQSSACQRSE